MTPARASHPLMASKPPEHGGHVLGPLVRFVRLERALIGRLYALIVLAGVAGVLTAAWRIDPGRATAGTHRQLGLPPCGFLLMTGLPCPTCGMTTAFAHTVRGDWLMAVRSQAAGLILALATLAAGTAALLTLVSGFRPALNWYRINPLHVVWWSAAAFVLAWAVKLGFGLLDGSLPPRSGS